MLVLNREYFFFDETVLDSFSEYVLGMAYDDDTRLFNKILVQHVKDAFEADKKLTEVVQEKIAPDIVPLVCFDFCNWCDLDKFDFYVISEDPDKKILKSQELQFYEYCDRYFGHINGLLIKSNQAFSDR